MSAIKKFYNFFKIFLYPLRKIMINLSFLKNISKKIPTKQGCLLWIRCGKQTYAQVYPHHFNALHYFKGFFLNFYLSKYFQILT